MDFFKILCKKVKDLRVQLTIHMNIIVWVKNDAIKCRKILRKKWYVWFRKNLIFFKDFFFFTCSPSRDYIDLPTTKSQVPKAFLCWTCYPPSRLNLVTSWVLYFSPFRYQFYWLVYRSNVSVKCLAQEHNIVVIFARRSPTLNQIRLDVAYLL